MHRLRFFPDYGGADPLWEADRRGGMVNLDRLPLSPATIANVRDWAARWEANAWRRMEIDDEGGPQDPELEAACEAILREGQALCEQLGQELGLGWHVEYDGG